MRLRVAAKCISGSFVKIAVGLDRQSPRIDSGHAFEINTLLVFGKPGAKSFGGVNHQNSFSFHRIKLIFSVAGILDFVLVSRLTKLNKKQRKCFIDTFFLKKKLKEGGRKI